MRQLLTGSPGIGWRPELARFVEQRKTLGFVEVLAEHLDPRRLPGPLRDVRDRGTPVVVHGLGLSLGGADRPSRRRLAHLARCAEALESPLISEHLAFVRAGRWDSHHLLPVPHTPEVLTENVALAQAALPVPLVLEDIATLVRWPGAEMTEPEFLTRLLERTGAGLLLDLANLWANTRNHGGDPVAALGALPLDRVAYVHVAGGVERDDGYYDTHLHPTPAGVFELVGALAARRPGAAVLLERDGHYPPEPALDAELAAIADALDAGPGAGGGVRRQSTARQRIAAAQVALLSALLAAADLPAGFDPAEAAAASSVLSRRRHGRPVSRLWRTARQECAGAAKAKGAVRAPASPGPVSMVVGWSGFAAGKVKGSLRRLRRP